MMSAVLGMFLWIIKHGDPSIEIKQGKNSGRQVSTNFVNCGKNLCCRKQLLRYFFRLVRVWTFSNWSYS